MSKRYTLVLFAGVAMWSLGTAASAALYTNNFDNCTSIANCPANVGTATWDFSGVHNGAAEIKQTNDAKPEYVNDSSRLHTKFLGEFGGREPQVVGDVVKFTVALPQDVLSVRLSFSAFLLRTWDGVGDIPSHSGPDLFNFGYMNGNTPVSLLPAAGSAFSNGKGLNTFCPDTGTATCAAGEGNVEQYRNKLGYEVMLDPRDPNPDIPQLGKELSMVYNFDKSVAFTGNEITFFFQSSGLQVHDDLTDPVPFKNIDVTRPQVVDESWGLDNIAVNVTTVPEPGTWAMLLTAFPLFASIAAWRRRQR